MFVNFDQFQIIQNKLAILLLADDLSSFLIKDLLRMRDGRHALIMLVINDLSVYVDSETRAWPMWLSKGDQLVFNSNPPKYLGKDINREVSLNIPMSNETWEIVDTIVETMLIERESQIVDHLIDNLKPL